MIPFKNKKKTLAVTVEEMRNFSFSYIERYAPSKQMLKTYLLKKYLKTSVHNVKKQDIKELIDVVLQDLEKTKFLSDKFYSETKSRSLIQRGSSINKIRSYLFSKGINDNFIKETIDKINEDNKIIKPAVDYNALGEGMLLVTDTNGNIETGDYICSSDRTGHGQKQDDDLLHNYTVAKATQPIDFSTKSDDSDLGYKSVLIACTYHCG